ncbi:hypothetical protein ACTXT7_009097 [Hymenolepis weldensis]
MQKGKIHQTKKWFKAQRNTEEATDQHRSKGLELNEAAYDIFYHPKTPKGVLTPGKTKKRQPKLQRSEFKCMGSRVQLNDKEVFQAPRKQPRRPRLNFHLAPGSEYGEISSSSDPAVDPLEDSDGIEEGIRTPKLKKNKPTSMSTPVKSTESQSELYCYSLRSQAS